MPDSQVQPFLAAIDRLYAAALDPLEWRSFLAGAAAMFGADNGYVCQAGDHCAFETVVLRDLDWSAESTSRYVAAIGKDRYLSGLRENPRRPAHCRIAVDSDLLHASRVYNETLKPLGVEYTLIVGAPEGSLIVNYVGFTRGPAGQPFSAADCAVLAELSPHLERAFAIRAALAGKPNQAPIDYSNDEAALHHLFGLSPMQARLTVLLRSGCRLKEAAVLLGLTEGSARQYLKAIFSKTGARRQIDLVRVVDSALREEMNAADSLQSQSPARRLDEFAASLAGTPSALRSVQPARRS